MLMRRTRQTGKPSQWCQGGQAQKRSHGNQCAQKRIGQIAVADEEEQVLVIRAEYDEHLRYLKKTQWDLNAIRSRTRKIGRINDGPRRKYTLVGREIQCLVDTGSPVNVIGETTFNSLSPRPKLILIISRC